MNKRSLGVAAVFLAGCAVGGVSSQLVVPKASAQQAATLTRWEYYCFTSEDMGGFVGQSNALGLQSWEMVSVVRGLGCFKRPKL